MARVATVQVASRARRGGLVGMGEEWEWLYALAALVVLVGPAFVLSWVVMRRDDRDPARAARSVAQRAHPRWDREGWPERWPGDERRRGKRRR